MSLNGIVFGWLQLYQATIAEVIWLKFGILVGISCTYTKFHGSPGNFRKQPITIYS